MTLSLSELLQLLVLVRPLLLLFISLLRLILMPYAVAAPGAATSTVVKSIFFLTFC